MYFFKLLKYLVELPKYFVKNSCLRSAGVVEVCCSGSQSRSKRLTTHRHCMEFATVQSLLLLDLSVKYFPV